MCIKVQRYTITILIQHRLCVKDSGYNKCNLQPYDDTCCAIEREYTGMSTVIRYALCMRGIIKGVLAYHLQESIAEVIANISFCNAEQSPKHYVLKQRTLFFDTYISIIIHDIPGDNERRKIRIMIITLHPFIFILHDTIIRKMNLIEREIIIVIRGTWSQNSVNDVGLKSWNETD